MTDWGPRFWALVHVPCSLEKDCWMWCGYKDKGGYGRYQIAKKARAAHRVSYEWFHGKIPEGFSLLHSCDVRSCVNPFHLRTGTHADNVADAKAKGRLRNGNTGKTHCKRGHEFTLENTHIKHNSRLCIACTRASHRKAQYAYMARKRAAA